MYGPNPHAVRRRPPMMMGNPANRLPMQQQQHVFTQQQQVGGVDGTGPLPPSLTPAEEQQMRRMQERQQLASQGFELLSRLLQLGAMIAQSGHQVLSIAVGTSFALQTFRGYVGGGGGAQDPHLHPPGAIIATPQAHGATASLVDSVGKSDATSSPGPVRKVLRGVSRSPAAIVALLSAVVIAEQLFRIWQRRKTQRRIEEQLQELDAEEAESAPRNASTAAQSDGVVLPTIAAATDDLHHSSASPSGGPVDTTYVARFTYDATAPNQLSLHPGDQLTIQDYTPDGWCWAATTNVRRSGEALSQQQGFIPGTHVEKLVAAMRRL